MHKSRISSIALLTLIAAMLACGLPTTPTVPTATAPPPTTAAPPTAVPTIPPPPSPPPPPPPDVRGPGFAVYSEIPVSLPAAYSGHTLP
ncbi:MAG: hypothetical protein KAX24_07520, partial [Anaerolineae bacterium]|nr:hypothetical protein [Anaerolineae bacterium]